MKSKIAFGPLVQVRAFDSVAEEIRKVILAGDLKSGSRLPSERSLAEQFQVGRLTIREALRTLEIEGLIRIKKGGEGGSFVGGADPRAVAAIIRDNMILEGLSSTQITEARIALECAAVRSAVLSATPEDLENVQRNLTETRAIIGSANPSETVSHMIHFHILIAEASHNLLFIIFVRALMEWAKSRPILPRWMPGVEAQYRSHREHEQILEALKRRKAVSAQRYMKNHIERIGDLLSAKGGRQTSKQASLPVM
jgi:DNA-binding FadR family transcriptional regulator